MHWVVELSLDRVAEEAVRALQHALSSHDAHPHVSVAAYGQLDTARCRDALAVVAAEQGAVDATFASWGAFPSAEPVLFLAPVVTDRLLALHRVLHERLAPLGHSRPYYRPGAWVPHCTVAIGLPASALPRVAEACRDALPIHARLESVALVEYHPRRELGTFDLR